MHSSLLTNLVTFLVCHMMEIWVTVTTVTKRQLKEALWLRWWELRLGKVNEIVKIYMGPYDYF